jgi:hypothetical protein
MFFAKRFNIKLQQFLCLLDVSVFEMRNKATPWATRKANDTLGVFFEELSVHAWFVVVPLKVCF